MSRPRDRRRGCHEWNSRAHRRGGWWPALCYVRRPLLRPPSCRTRSARIAPIRWFKGGVWANLAHSVETCVTRWAWEALTSSITYRYVIGHGKEPRTHAIKFTSGRDSVSGELDGTSCWLLLQKPAPALPTNSRECVGLDSERTGKPLLHYRLTYLCHPSFRVHTIHIAHYEAGVILAGS